MQVFSVRSRPLGDCLCAGPSHAGRLALEAELEPRSLRPSGVLTDMPCSVLPPGFHQALPSSGNNFLCLPGSLYSWCHFLGEAYRESLDQQSLPLNGLLVLGLCLHSLEDYGPSSLVTSGTQGPGLARGGCTGNVYWLQDALP